MLTGTFLSCYWRFVFLALFSHFFWSKSSQWAQVNVIQTAKKKTVWKSYTLFTSNCTRKASVLKRLTDCLWSVYGHKVYIRRWQNDSGQHHPEQSYLFSLDIEPFPPIESWIGSFQPLSWIFCHFSKLCGHKDAANVFPSSPQGTRQLCKCSMARHEDLDRDRSDWDEKRPRKISTQPCRP